MFVRLVSPIFSKPVKQDCAVVSNAPVIMVVEATAISVADSGLLKIAVAMKAERPMRIAVIAKPDVISKSVPAVMMARASWSLFWALRLAVYFVMAEFIPQSRNKTAMYEGMRAME